MKSFINIEFLFVKFPIIFPIIYCFVLFQLPTYETYLIFFTILLLAEPHFGATWPFLLDKSNHSHIKENKISFFFLPLILVIFCLIGFFTFKKIFYLIFFAINIYHVTRQSFGVSKLYSEDKKDINFQEKFIYLFNSLFFLVGYFRFFLNINLDEYLFFINYFFVATFILSIISYVYLYKFNQNLFSFITGCIIFYPVCFVSNPVHVILLGVTMHFSQYLYLTNRVVIGRYNKKTNFKSFLKISKYFIVVIIVYATIMAILSLLGKNEDVTLKSLIIIPIIGQMLHFYLDSQLWKFSLKHNRDNVLKHLKS